MNVKCFTKIACILSLISVSSSFAEPNETNGKLSLNCKVKAFMANGVVEEVTDRQARSTPGFIQEVTVSETKIVVVTELGEIEANFRKQVLRTPDGLFQDDLTKQGVIHDMYVDSGNELVFQYYLSWSKETLFTHLTTFMYKRSAPENGRVVVSNCYRKP